MNGDPAGSRRGEISGDAVPAGDRADCSSEEPQGQLRAAS